MAHQSVSMDNSVRVLGPGCMRQVLGDFSIGENAAGKVPVQEKTQPCRVDGSGQESAPMLLEAVPTETGTHMVTCSPDMSHLTSWPSNI